MMVVIGGIGLAAVFVIGVRLYVRITDPDVAARKEVTKLGRI